MSAGSQSIAIPDEIVMGKIYLIRGKKVLLDKDLAGLYGVDTKQLKRAVRRNISRFPEDFMFELNKNEFKDLRRQFGTSSWGGARYLPMAFTEYGVLMLASVLNSDRAIGVNIQIARIFNRMREILASHAELLNKLAMIEEKMGEHDNQIQLIFEYLKQLESARQQELEYKSRKPIGFRSKGSWED
jgi:phage regulator Rha-like protein